MEEFTITVSQLNAYIKQIFEAEELLYNISVKGEISGLKSPTGNLAFFDLKDEFSQIHCVCFDESAYKSFRNGDFVVARGCPQFYTKGGRLDFNVNKLTPYGKGDLYLKFLQLKENLEAEGLFDVRAKKPLPKEINRIGVVTSETGAVIEDIINVATRRNPSINIVLYPTRVQGSGAEFEIKKGIEFFSNYNVDVIIVARGGGSFEDLNVFNMEVIARSAFECAKPIISAIGHETDFTILDFVADVRASTPSVAAELAVADIKSSQNLFKSQCLKLNTIIKNNLSDLKNQLQFKQSLVLNKMKEAINGYKYFVTLKMTILEKLNPNNILKIGYAKVSKGESTIVSSKQLSSGDKIKINFFDGKVEGEIK
ncbi:MAG: exodeoxyribonuclease VII large subunit [Clostridia bacterium]|nr:exodeoxyribonuclease VII large subunit [Clostridia bacterium]